MRARQLLNSTRMFSVLHRKVEAGARLLGLPLATPAMLAPSSALLPPSSPGGALSGEIVRLRKRSTDAQQMQVKVEGRKAVNVYTSELIYHMSLFIMQKKMLAGR